MENSIGLPKEQVTELNSKLNELLANYEVYYQNLRGFHWNIKGNSFFELHAKFEELYTLANEAVDEIAERILTLEGKPLHTFTDFVGTSKIKEARDVSSDTETVKLTVDNLGTLIEIERDILKLAGDAGDEGTVDLMSGYIKMQEKTVWMLNAYLK